MKYGFCISIHSPYTGRDRLNTVLSKMVIYFNPLSLYRERLFGLLLRKSLLLISIHSPYTGRDSESKSLRSINGISIHSPYTGRDRHDRMRGWIQETFQSTLPIQGETNANAYFHVLVGISIHSPYTGRDTTISDTMRIEMYFNPLSLYRERRNSLNFFIDRIHFNPLSLYRERLP